MIPHADPAAAAAAAIRRLLAARSAHIADTPDLVARWQHAVDHADDPDPAASRAAIEEQTAVLHEALAAVGGNR